MPVARPVTRTRLLDDARDRLYSFAGSLSSSFCDTGGCAPAEHFRRAADVAMVLVELLQNVVALIGGSRLVQRGSLGARDSAAAIAMHQRRKMLRSKRDVVGFMITMRSITLRNSRTFPGQA